MNAALLAVAMLAAGIQYNLVPTEYRLIDQAAPTEPARKSSEPVAPTTPGPAAVAPPTPAAKPPAATAPACPTCPTCPGGQCAAPGGYSPGLRYPARFQFRRW